MLDKIGARETKKECCRYGLSSVLDMIVQRGPIFEIRIKRKCPRRKADHKNAYNLDAKNGQRLPIRHTGMSRHVVGGDAEKEPH